MGKKQRYTSSDRPCFQCRKDRKECTPIQRTWPQKCSHCIKWNHVCSPPQKIGQEILQQKSASGPPYSPEILKAHWAHEFFQYLREAGWKDFGSPRLSQVDFDAEEVAAAQVWGGLQYRLELIDIARKYKEAFMEGASDDNRKYPDMRAYASRKLFFEIGKGEHEAMRKEEYAQCDVREGMVNGLIHDFEGTMRGAFRWEMILDAFGVPEILLMDFVEAWGYKDPEEESQILVSDVESADDGRFRCLLSTLRSPDLDLQDYCDQLGGVVGKIQRLIGLDVDCEVRKALVQEIEMQVRNVFDAPEPVL